MNPLLNKQVLIGLPLLKERLANMDQRDSDGPFKDSMLHLYCLFPLALVSVQAEGGMRYCHHKVKCSSRISVG